jgi:hypothetical protein
VSNANIRQWRSMNGNKHHVKRHRRSTCEQLEMEKVPLFLASIGLCNSGLSGLMSGDIHRFGCTRPWP